MGLLNELDDLARIVTKGFDEGKTVESAAANASKTESSAARSLGRELPPATLPGTPMPSVESLILKGAQNNPDVSKLTPARFDPNSVEIPESLFSGNEMNYGKPVTGSTTVLQGDPHGFASDVLEPAKLAVTEGNSVGAQLKDGSVIQLVRMNEGGAESRIIALDNDGNLMGDLSYGQTEDGLNPDVYVPYEARRRGVATAMYDLAEATGGRIPEFTAPNVRTDAGAAFRKARHERGSGKTVFIPNEANANNVDVKTFLNQASRNPAPASTASKDIGEVHDAVIKNRELGGGAWAHDRWDGAIELHSNSGPHNSDTVVATVHQEDGKYYADVGINKELRGTGEGSAAYETLGKWAKNNSITISASDILTPQNTIKRSGNVAAAIMKEGDSSIFGVSPQQFIYTTDTFSSVIDSDSQGSKIANLVGDIGYKDYQESAFAKGKTIKLEDIEPTAAQIHDEAVDNYYKYWNPDADAKDAEVVKQRANNLIANQVSGIISTMFNSDRWRVRHFGTSDRDLAFATEFIKFLGTESRSATLKTIQKDLVPVGGKAVGVPMLKKLTTFLSRHPEFKNTVIPAAALGVGIETQSDDEVSKQNVQ